MITAPAELREHGQPGTVDITEDSLQPDRPETWAPGTSGAFQYINQRVLTLAGERNSEWKDDALQLLRREIDVKYDLQEITMQERLLLQELLAEKAGV